MLPVVNLEYQLKKIMSNYLDKRLSLLESRKNIKKQLEYYTKQLKLIDGQIAALSKNNDNRCPKCDYRSETKLELKSHLFEKHSY